MKAHTDFAISMEEKKCEATTRALVDKFAASEVCLDFLTTVEPSRKLTREERMHIVPILCKYCSNDDLVRQLQASLVEDLTYCRVTHEKISDLSNLIYFVQRTGCGEVLPQLKDAFISECRSMDGINFDRMADRALRMFTWVYLSAFDERLNPEVLTQTHIARMDQIGFDAEMSKFILKALENDDALRYKYLHSLAYTKLINKETALPGPEVDLIELVNIVMDHQTLVMADTTF